MSRTKAVMAGWHGPHKPRLAARRALRRASVDPPAWAPLCVGCGLFTPLLRRQDDGSDIRLCDECEGQHE